MGKTPRGAENVQSVYSHWDVSRKRNILVFLHAVVGSNILLGNSVHITISMVYCPEPELLQWYTLKPELLQ
jgi:hypothetical protein